MFNLLKKLVKYTIVYPILAIVGYSVIMTTLEWNDPENIKAREVAAIEREAKEADEAYRVAQAKAQNKIKGFHCLSSWDGSHKNLARLVENNMRNPDSFDHVETYITPVDVRFEHTITMKYRGQNGFGGMSIETVSATIDHNSCKIKKINI